MSDLNITPEQFHLLQQATETAHLIAGVVQTPEGFLVGERMAAALLPFVMQAHIENTRHAEQQRWREEQEKLKEQYNKLEQNYGGAAMNMMPPQTGPIGYGKSSF